MFEMLSVNSTLHILCVDVMCLCGKKVAISSAGNFERRRYVPVSFRRIEHSSGNASLPSVDDAADK